MTFVLKILVSFHILFTSYIMAMLEASFQTYLQTYTQETLVRFKL